MSYSNKLWTTVKEMINNRNKVPPRLINFSSRVVTSLREISTIANEHYISKVKNIREKFSFSEVTHINILEKLIKKPTSKFHLPKITLKGVKDLIKNMKSSNAIGHDAASIKIYKKLQDRLGPHI